MIAPGDKGTTTGQFTSFIPHIGCHNAFIFESSDGCYGYGSGCMTSTPTAPADPSLALMREKLQTIEETQAEDVAQSGAHDCCTHESSLDQSTKSYCQQATSVAPSGTHLSISPPPITRNTNHLCNNSSIISKKEIGIETALKDNMIVHIETEDGIEMKKLKDKAVENTHKNPFTTPAAEL